MLSMSFSTPPPACRPGERLLEPVRAFAAGNAPAAALVLVELHGAQGELDDADGLVEHDDAAGAEHRASLAHLVEVEADVDFVGGQDRAEDPPGTTALSFLPPWMPPPTS